MRNLVSALIGVVVGLAVHELAFSRTWREQARGGAAVVEPARCDIDWARMRAEMHSVVRDTLSMHDRSQAHAAASAERPLGGATASAAGAADGGTERPPPRASQTKAWADHAALLAGAEHRGTWNDDDARAMRQLVAALPPADRTQALAAVAKGINRGRFKLVAEHPF